MIPNDLGTTVRETHLKDYYRTLRKHRWLVCGLFLATVFTVAIWSFVDGGVVSPAISQNALPAKVYAADSQKSRPAERAKPWYIDPWYGCQNWLVENGSLSTTQLWWRLRRIDEKLEW